MKKIFFVILTVIHLNVASQSLWTENNQGLPTKSVTVTSITSDGNTLLASSKKGISISIDNGNTWTELREQSLFWDDHRFIKQFGKQLFMATEYSGLMVSYDGGYKWKFDSNLPLSSRVLSIAEADTNFYLGTNKGLYSLSKTSKNVIELSFGNSSKPVVNDVLVAGNMIFAGTNSGLYLSDNNGKMWTMAGKIPSDGSVKSLTNLNNTILAATSKGLYFSKDNGKNWTITGIDIPADNFVASVAAANNKMFYLTSDKLYVSDEKCETWKTFAENLTNAISLSLQNNELFLLTNDGLFKVDKNSNKIKSADQGMPREFVKIFDIDGNKSEIYAATEKGLFISVDNGLEWKACKINGNIIANVKNISVSGRTVFVMNDSFVYISNDKGNTWKAAGDDVFNGLTPIVMVEKINGFFYAVTESGGVFNSSDGVQWTLTTKGFPKAAFIQTYTWCNGVLYVGTLSGLFKYSPDDKWIAIDKGLPSKYTSSLTSIGKFVFAGTDNGVYKKNQDDTWSFSGVGLKDEITVNHLATSGGYLFADLYGELFLSKDSGQFWSHYPFFNYPFKALSSFSSDSSIFFGTESSGILSINNTSKLLGVLTALPEQQYVSSLTDEPSMVGQISIEAPEAGDYLLFRKALEGSGSFVFKNSCNVYYEYDFRNQDKTNVTKQSKDIISKLFLNADKLDFLSRKSRIERDVPDDVDKNLFYVIEYRKNGKLYKICWDTSELSLNTFLLNKLAEDAKVLW